MTCEEAQQHIEQIRVEKRRADSSDLRAALKLLAEELNSKETHFILELLQNAEDNEYADKEPELGLSISADDPTRTSSANGCLIVINNEVGFKLENVRSLCSVGQSTKKERNQGYIGEKGIGFKSVFRVTDSPHIFSNGLQFRFQVPTETEGFGYILPHWVETVPQVAAEGFTAILLPLQPGKREVIERQLSKIAPETVLFLKKLKRLRLGDTRSISCGGPPPLLRLCSNNEEALYYVQSQQFVKPPDIIEEKRQAVSSRDVTIAFPLKTGTVCTGRIFAFLPTEFDSGLPFLVNADFILNFNRERVLEDRRWNQWLRDEIAPTFSNAFLSVLKETEWRTDAWRFLPIGTELTPGAEFFAPTIESIKTKLKKARCILTDDGGTELPEKVFSPGALARQIIHDAPRERFTFSLLNPAWESEWQKRLKPLGVQSLTFAQVFEVCNDETWLKSRNTAWWETLLELCAECDIKAETVGSFPILFCQDGNYRPISSGVFLNPASRTRQAEIAPEWPPAYLIDAKLQEGIQQKPKVLTWLTKTAGLQPFSVQSYITGKLLAWMRAQSGAQAAERIVAASHFVAANLDKPDEHSQTLREKMPLLLADKRLLSPVDRSDKELVTPECIENNAGWNWVFISAQDRQHFWLLSDDYFARQPEPMRDAIRKLMGACGATNLPDPARLHHLNGQINWGCPRWLRDLDSNSAPQNLDRKIDALERWIGRFTPEGFAKFLTLSSADNGVGLGSTGASPSELGMVLCSRPWLRSTTGLVSPSSAVVDDPEIRAFLGNSVPYSQSKLANEILGKLGTCLRLTATALVKLLRQMRDAGSVDEALVVRIYRRLQTMEFDASIFRAEPLIFLAIPSARWMQTGQVFWNDAGSVFDEKFGCAKLTYEQEELLGFFTAKLGVFADVPEQQLAEVWAQMSSGEVPAPEVVEKRLAMILEKLMKIASAEVPPDWWAQMKSRLKVWTTAKHFDTPAGVYAPDDTFAETLFEKTARIAWKPKALDSAKLNRLLENLGCRSLAHDLRRRAAHAVVTQFNGDPRLLTRASKDLLLCWVCATNGWSSKRQQLEQLLKTDETLVAELRVEYWLEGDAIPPSSNEADAFWSSLDHRLYLRQNATAKAQQAAAAKSIAAEFNRHGKQGEDTVYRLLSLEATDARRELAERKWQLTPEQKAWLQSFSHQSEIMEISTEATNHDNRESRPTIAPQTPSGGSATSTPQQQSAPEAQPETQPTSDRQSVPSSPNSSQADSGATRTPGQTGAGLRGVGNERTQQTRSAESEEDSSRPLKSSDAEAEFVHVTAHTRMQPGRKGQTVNDGARRQPERNPLAGVSQATKAEMEDTATKIVLHQITRKGLPEWQGFRADDYRHRNLGFDVLAMKQGKQIRIEIKAHLRQATSVFVTSKEWQESRKQFKGPPADHWELWNVENLAGDTMGKVRITRYRHLPESARSREVGYWVDLSACASESI